MSKRCGAIALCLLVAAGGTPEPPERAALEVLDGIERGVCDGKGPFVLVVHGGAIGGLEQLPPEIHELVLESAPAFIGRVLPLGRELLAEGARSLEVVHATIQALEDSGLFNAGRGAIANQAGVVETDASIMDGRTLDAGAIASVRGIKNPISAAKMVMERSPHVMLVGPEAESFVARSGGATVEPSYFLRKESDASKGDGGTVGAVALDRCGDLAAGTSTGGWERKSPGRVGDSPIIGAGTYANNATVAVSATGHGEYFMRFVVAHDISAMMEYGGLSLEEATRRVIHGKLRAGGGDGGVIAVDREGNVATPFNTKIMLRGVVTDRKPPEVSVY